jgi:hypothetical protein
VTTLPLGEGRGSSLPAGQVATEGRGYLGDLPTNSDPIGRTVFDYKHWPANGVRGLPRWDIGRMCSAGR